MSSSTNTLPRRTGGRTKAKARSQRTNGRGNGAKNGLLHLEALEILPLPIFLRNGQPVDVEHTSSAEFSLWLRWNGIPWIGDSEWDFDSKCIAVNHALRHGLRPRLIAPLPDCLRGCLLHPLSELFEILEPILESSEDDYVCPLPALCLLPEVCPWPRTTQESPTAEDFWGVGE